MAKAKQSRRLADNETRAFLRSLDTSVQKAGLVLEQIRGQHVEKALATLTFSPKGVASDIKKLLESAIANAENNQNLNVDSLYIKEAVAGKSFTLKRWSPRARGRVGKIMKPRTHISITVEERAEQAAEAK